MKTLHGWLIAGGCLLALGLLLAVSPVMQYLHGESVPRVAASPFSGTPIPIAEPPVFVEGKPVRVQVPSLDIDLPVVEGRFNAKTSQWTLTNDKVHYAVMTPLANNREGNTFLYGHNREGVFKELNRIRLDDTVIVTTDNDHTFTYRFAGALETVPSDDSLFHYEGKPILTIQTCSGVWYQNRQLFTFNLETAE